MTEPLSLALVDLLLDGHTRHPDAVPADERDTYDHFLEFDPWPRERVEALWRAHGDALRAEQRRRAGERAPR
jgi:hypothetical protein